MKRIVIPSTGRAIRKELPETRTSQPSTPAIRSSPSSWRRFSRCVHRPLSTPDVLISWPSKDLRVSTEEGEPCSCRQGMALKDMFPLPEQILEMEPEELAAFVLRYLKSGVGEMKSVQFWVKGQRSIWRRDAFAMLSRSCDRLLGCRRLRCHNRTDAYRRVRWTRRPNVRDLELAALRRTGVRLCVGKFLCS